MPLSDKFLDNYNKNEKNEKNLKKVLHLSKKCGIIYQYAAAKPDVPSQTEGAPSIFKNLYGG